MLELVSIADACAWVALDPPDSDGGDQRHRMLEIAIRGASEAGRGWQKGDWRRYLEHRDTGGGIATDGDGDPGPETDRNGAPITHPSVTEAVLFEVAMRFRFRYESGGDNDSGAGYVLSKAATAMLAARRKP